MNVYEQIRYLWEKSPQDFERRVQGWADNLEKKREEVKRNRSLFRAWKPLEVYVSYSFINSGVFSIRFFGQEVAKLKVVDGKKILIFGEKHVRHNEKYFKLKGFGVIRASGQASRSTSWNRSFFGRCQKSPARTSFRASFQRFSLSRWPGARSRCPYRLAGAPASPSQDTAT